MDTVCSDLPSVFVYLGDILIASCTEEKHLHDLQELFKGLATDHGLVIGLKKCIFGVTTIEFLGHHIDSNGAMPLPSKVEAIRQFQEPSWVKGIQECLEMINFYHRFLPDAAKIMQPLYAALVGKPAQ